MSSCRLVLLVAAIGVLSTVLALHFVRRQPMKSQAHVAWQAPSDEVDIQVAFISSSKLAVVSRQIGSNNSSAVMVRTIDVTGNIVAQINLDSGYSSVHLQGVSSDGRYLALNLSDQQTAFPDRIKGSLIDLRSGSCANLPPGYVFPVGPYGNPQLFSATGEQVIIQRLDPELSPILVADAASGDVLRAIPGIPRRHAPVIRWEDKITLVRWLDTETGALRIEGDTSTSDQQSVPRFVNRHPVVLSLDGTLLATYGRTRDNKAYLEIFTTATGDLVRRTQWAVGSQQEISSTVWSPDNRRLAISIMDDAELRGTSLYLLASSGSLRQIVLPRWRFSGYSSGISWSPDARYLAAVAYPESGDGRENTKDMAVAIIDVEGYAATSMLQ